MKAYQINTIDGKRALSQVTLEKPVPKDNEVLVNIKAVSLNYRDLGITSGSISYPGEKLPMIPLCDGAGEIVEIGKAVSNFKVGDRVTANFFPEWTFGGFTAKESYRSLGGNMDGMLAEYVALPAEAWVKINNNHSFIEAATLPCAGVTAYQALFERGNLLQGQTVLCLGTGGVSIFALQMAKKAGATVIITSSSDEKLQKAKALGADHLINYKNNPEWYKEVKKYTNDLGVDHIIEVGGQGTLSQSLRAVKPGGKIHLIGVLAEQQHTPQLVQATMKAIDIHGIYVGSSYMFNQLNIFLQGNDIHPIIHKTFGFENVKEAYQMMQDGRHFGKIAIEL